MRLLYFVLGGLVGALVALNYATGAINNINKSLTLLNNISSTQQNNN